MPQHYPLIAPMVERALSTQPKTARQIFEEIGRVGSVDTARRSLNEFVRARRAVKDTIPVRRGGEANVFRLAPRAGATSGDCPVCAAKDGEACSGQLGTRRGAIVSGLLPDGAAHLRRLQPATTR